MKNKKEVNWITPEQAAIKLGVSVSTLRRRVRAGLITPKKSRGCLEFRESDVIALLEKTAA